MGRRIARDISLLAQKLRDSRKIALLQALIELVTHLLCQFIFEAVLHSIMHVSLC
jgi:hypothetical protein